MPKMSDSPVSFLIERSLGNAQDGTLQSFPDPGLEPLLFRAVPPLAPGVVILTTARGGTLNKAAHFRAPGPSNQERTELRRSSMTALPPQEASGNAGS